MKGLWNHTWSLAVEEHFYFLLPLVCLLVIRARKPQRANGHASLRPMLLVGALIAVVELALRIGNARGPAPLSPFTHVFATHLRLDSLFFGVMLSYAYHFHTERFVRVFTPWRVPLMLGGVLLLTPAFLLPLETSPMMRSAGFTVMYLGSGMLLVGTLLCRPRPGPVLGFLAALGAGSYLIYLWHMPVLLLGVPMLEQAVGAPFSFGVRATLYLGGSLALGMAMARLIEIPSLRWRERLFPRRAAATIGARAARAIDAPPAGAVIV
ncbi:MAG TPA: acyltransferase family protein [Gemmatimonadaceae bacterium]|nr:acyltransferase family protein [Gemmatimonadaceae bacterium]